MALLFLFRWCATAQHPRTHQSDEGLGLPTSGRFLTLTQGFNIRRWSSADLPGAVGTKVRLFHKSPTYFLCSRFSVAWLSSDSGATSDGTISGRQTGSWPPPARRPPLGARGRKTWRGHTSSHATSYNNCIVIINYGDFFLVFFILLQRRTQTT